MEFYESPSYIGFVDGHTDKKSLKKYRKQYEKRGFDDTTLWSLDACIAKFIYPRLIRFSKVNGGVPYCEEKGRPLTKEEWKEILLTMASGFKIMEEDRIPLTEEEYAKMDLSLELLAKWFGALWI